MSTLQDLLEAIDGDHWAEASIHAKAIRAELDRCEFLMPPEFRNTLSISFCDYFAGIALGALGSRNGYTPSKLRSKCRDDVSQKEISEAFASDAYDLSEAMIAQKIKRNIT